MKTAIVSVSDKTNVEHLVNYLLIQNYQIYSTGGTYKYLKERVINPDKVIEVSTLTDFPEILGGRVKTLHPKIYGGLLAKRNDSNHMIELDNHNIPCIDVVVVNLYPFDKAIRENMDMDVAVELIDIGGVTLIRAAAKNFKDVLVVSDPKDYDIITLTGNNCWSQDFRKELAIKAFRHTSNYDDMIQSYLFGNHVQEERRYMHGIDLKYGCNPYQGEAAVWSLREDGSLPFKVINGKPGYINILDAINGWQLVKDLKTVLGLPAAASFKHTSPAGAAISVPLSDRLKNVYMCQGKQLTPLATAYLRARNADPMSSFGDFIALSDEVDEATARLIKIEVSDGIIAPGFTDKALEILTKKKGGKYIILEADQSWEHSGIEYREMYGVALSQYSNDSITDYSYLDNIVVGKEFTDEQKRDLIVANIALKYAQSNNVAFALDGQIIGLAAGQQSRVDCVKLAVRKVQTWFLRQIVDLEFVKGTKRQDKVNQIVNYIDQNRERLLLEMSFDMDVCLASDAFFPFPDSIEIASKVGTTAVLQPGGSIADKLVVESCKNNNITMAFSGLRLFTH